MTAAVSFQRPVREHDIVYEQRLRVLAVAVGGDREMSADPNGVADASQGQSPWHSKRMRTKRGWNVRRRSQSFFVHTGHKDVRWPASPGLRPRAVRLHPVGVVGGRPR